jgi:glycosyltransferase involved in cell wall biosynthesis
MNGDVIVFLIPFDKTMVSAYVRAKCLIGFEPKGVNFKFIEGTLPKLINVKYARDLYELYFFTKSVILLEQEILFVYIIKPKSLLLIKLLRKILGLRVVIDINDPIHLSAHIGFNKTLKIIKHSNHVVFESLEYKLFWNNFINLKSTLIEDTPQIESIFINFKHRKKTVVWFGLPSTSEILLDYIPHLYLFNKMGYTISILGASKSVANNLEIAGIVFNSLFKYDHTTLVDYLSKIQIAFVPMLNSDEFTLRGNLKAKMSMACGCLTIASKIRMHERLIVHGKTGFLFTTLMDLQSVLEIILANDHSNIAKNGNIYIVKNFTRLKHADQIYKIVEKLY